MNFGFQFVVIEEFSSYRTLDCGEGTVKHAIKIRYKIKIVKIGCVICKNNDKIYQFHINLYWCTNDYGIELLGKMKSL